MSNYHKIDTKIHFSFVSDKHKLVSTYRCAKCGSEVIVQNYEKLYNRDTVIRIFIRLIAFVSTMIFMFQIKDYMGLSNFPPIYSLFKSILIRLALIPFLGTIGIVINVLLLWVYRFMLMRKICRYAGKCRTGESNESGVEVKDTNTGDGSMI